MEGKYEKMDIDEREEEEEKKQREQKRMLESAHGADQQSKRAKME